MQTPSRALRAIAVLALAASAAACGHQERSAAGRTFTSGRELLQAMHDLYQGHWPRNVTFVQQTVRFPKEGQADTTTWYEALTVGKLRIDMAPLDQGNGALYVNGMRYSFRGGQLADSAAETNPLAVLLADVYLQPVERSAKVLDSLGVALGPIRRDTWKGTPVWIVGAPPGDSTSPQFWVEADRLLTVRAIQPLGKALLDARIGDWKRLGDGWVETHLDLYVNGKLFQTEDYSRIRSPKQLDPALFDPTGWKPITDDRYWEGDGAS